MAKTTTIRTTSAAIMTRLRLHAIVDDAGCRANESLGKDLQHQRQRDRTRPPGQLQQQTVNCQSVEPVADFADDLRQPKPPKVPVNPHQPQIRG